MNKRKGVRITFIFTLAITLVLVFSLNSYSWQNPHLLMTPDDVEKILNDPNWVILDCRDPKDYEKEHIPNAISIGSCMTALRDGTERLLPPAELEKILGRAGIGNDKHVVVYTEAKKMPHGGIGFWALEYLGHDKVYFLDGGFDMWKAMGKPVTPVPTTLKSTTFKAKIVHSRLAITEEVAKIARGELIARGERKDVQLLDCRTKAEFEGTDIRALRGGRIPNTTANIPHDLAYDRKTGVFFDPTYVESLYRGLDKNIRTIVVCQTGSCSTITYLILRLLGFKDVANYDSGWVVYANAAHMLYPVEREQWINLEIFDRRLREEVN
jgi:thiosulfate/3-mercaptopyruvate sulfurtransferase